MDESSTHINYTFEDIQRYLQGKMSAAEMHNIEKSALHDPFLADAIEGYREVGENEALKQLNSINASLFAEKKKAKVVSFNNKTRWLRIAALIIIIAGAGILADYFLKHPAKQQEVAQVKKEPAINPNPTDAAAGNSDVLSPAKDSATPAVAQNKLKMNLAPSEKRKAPVNRSISEDSNMPAGDVSLTAKNYSPPQVQQNETASGFIASAPLSNAMNDSVRGYLQGRVAGLNITTNTFSGKVIDENNKPVAGAVVESADKKTVVITGLDGYFSLQKNDSLVNVTASTAGYKSEDANLRSGDANLIILKNSGSALNDVVVVGYGAQKKKIADTAAAPVGGWKNFNNYVLTRLNKDTTTDAITGPDDLVEIEFFIDKTGNPYNFKVIKPLDEQRNAKAIEILKSGPKWTNTSKNKKARVRISF